jgi:hypothetical protein
MRNPEFQLVVAACRASMSGDRLRANAVDIQWDQFAAVAERHRVQALCWHALRPLAGQIPSETAAKLRDQTRVIATANLKAAAESGRLLDQFQAGDVRLLFLKGLTLAALAYRDPFLKMGVDIDLLIDPAQLADASRLLRSSGYIPVIPAGADDQQLARWHHRRKESVWHNGQFQVDLHTRLADHPTMLRTLRTGSPTQAVSVASGITLPTLAKDELFAYLCVHGASSAWFRLK